MTAAELVESGSRLLGALESTNSCAVSEVPAIGLVMSNDRVTVECLLSAMASARTVVSLPPPPPRGQLADDYIVLLKQTVATHNLSQIVAQDRTATRLAAAGLPIAAHSALQDSGGAKEQASHRVPTGHKFQLVQYSSGSTAAPKPILLDDTALGANVTSILQRLAPTDGDGVVSWLPLSHDMGLIGMLLATIVGFGPTGADGGELVLLEPETFLRSPARWLGALSEQRATITACPDFGLRWLTQRPGPQVDLSSLRCIIVGGEIVRADTLASVVETFEPWGLRPKALCPSYGLAELGLAGTVTPPGEGWRELTLDPALLADRQIQVFGDDLPGGVTGVPERHVGQAEPLTLVASGPPLSGYEVSTGVFSEEVGTTGPIRVAGASIGADGCSGRSLADKDGWLTTGDMGFINRHGWLYVTGRGDDYVVAHGRNLFAPVLDESAGQVSGVRAGRAAAVGAPTGELVVVAEVAPTAKSAGEFSRIRADLRRAVGRAGGVQAEEVVLVGRGEMPYTTSGKLRRAELMRRLSVGELRHIGD